jgi:hypothetical protein
MSFMSRLGFRFGLIGLGIGVALVAVGWEDFSISAKTKAQPTTITAAALSKAGPPKDNAYVHVTNYAINQEYIIETKDDSKLWDRVWLQAIPQGQTAESAGKPIVIKDGGISTEDELNRFEQQTSFDGIVTNGITSISPPKTPSGMHFPEVDGGKVWLVEMRDRPDTGTAFGFTGAGLIFLLGGGFLSFTGFRTRAKPGTIINSNVGGRNRR